MAEINFGKSTKIEITPTKRDDYESYNRFCARQLDESRYHHERDKSKKRLLAMFAIILVVSGLAFCAVNGLIGFSVSEPEIVDEPISVVSDAPSEPMINEMPEMNKAPAMPEEPLEVQSMENVTACGTLSTPGTTYTLNRTIQASGRCLTVGADNIMIDCQGNLINGTGSGEGIYIYQRNNITVTNCSIKKFTYGIYMTQSKRTNITHSETSYNTYGIYNQNSDYSFVESNNISVNGNYNLYIWDSSNGTFINNFIQEMITGGSSLHLDVSIFGNSPQNGQCNHIIENNLGTNNLPIEYYNSSSIIENKLLSELILCNADYSTVNNVTAKGTGIVIVKTDYSNITNCIVQNSSGWGGFLIQGGSYNLFENSISNFNGQGFYIQGESGSSFINNTANNNGNRGFYLWNGVYNLSMLNNTANNNQYGILSEGGGGIKDCKFIGNYFINNSKSDFQNTIANPGECSGVIFENNTGSNNLPIGFYTGDNQIIENAELSGLTLCESNNFTINNATVSGVSGILFDWSHNGTLANSKILNALYGLYLQSSTGNSVYNNLFSNSSHSGIYVGYNSDRNRFFNNTINNSQSYAVYLYYGYYNNFSNNTITNGNNGIYTYYSSSDGIYEGNTITGVYYYALFLSDSNSTFRNNRIYGNGYGAAISCPISDGPDKIYNNFFNNSENVWIAAGDDCTYRAYFNTTKKKGTRIFSNGPAIGGNYWADYYGTGFSENCTDSDADGFCDSSYVFRTTWADHLPLSNNYSASESIPPIITINSPQDILYSVSQIYFEVSINEMSDWCGFSIDGAGNITMNGDDGFTYYYNETVGDGDHNVTFSCNDTAGNRNYTSRHFSVDATSPKVYLISPENGYATVQATQTFKCNMTNQEISNLTLHIWNSTGDLNYTNTTQLTGTFNETNWTYTLPYDNGWVWSCLGYDAAGNSNWSTEGNRTLLLGNADISQCMNLLGENLVYSLLSDVTYSGTCFNVKADNVTLDCKGHMINSSSGIGSGVNVSNYGNFTLKNCLIQGFNEGVTISSSSNNLFINASILQPVSSFLASDSSSSFNNLTGIKFASQYGSIRYPQNINFSGQLNVNLSKVHLNNNQTYLNSSELGLFNSSAELTIYGSTTFNPQPLMDLGDNGTYEVCNSTTVPACEELGYSRSSGTFVFNVSHFTTYSSNETGAAGIVLSSCGEINESGYYLLTADVQATDPNNPCFKITANDVTLDCSGFTINGTGNSWSDKGIYIYGSGGWETWQANNTGVIVENCNIKNFYQGVYLEFAANTTFINNYINTNYSSGTRGYVMYFEYSSTNATLINNTLEGGQYGLYLGGDSFYNSVMINNTFRENSQYDFNVDLYSTEQCRSNQIEDNTGSNNLPIGFYNSSVSLENAQYSQLFLCDADYSRLENITINGSRNYNNDDLWMAFTDYSNITNVLSWNNYYGFYLRQSSNNNFINDSAILNQDSGFYVYDSSYNNKFIDLNAASNARYGLDFVYSYLNTIYNSTLEENSDSDLFIESESSSNCRNKLENVTGSNDLPIELYNSSSTIENKRLSQLILCGANNAVVDNVTIDASPSIMNNGIYVLATNNSIIVNSTSSKNRYGVYILGDWNNRAGWNNSIINNVFYSNYYGVYLYMGRNGQVENNIINYSRYGIYSQQYSNGYNITNNTISYQAYDGIYWGYGNNNTISNNIIKNTSGSYYAGIHFSWYNGQYGANRIYNNLLNNTRNFRFDDTSYKNNWNTTRQTGTRVYSLGNEIGGNYYANASGIGFSDSCTDGNADGFCDSSYTLATNNVDYLPLSDEGTGVDNTPPIITVISPLNTTYYNLIVDFNVSLNEAGSWCGFSLDGAENITMTNFSSTYFNYTNSTMTETSHNVTFSCNDTSNNWDSSEMTYFSSQLNVPPPFINITSPLSNSVLDNRTINVSFTAHGSDYDPTDYNYTNISVINSAGAVVNSTVNSTPVSIIPAEGLVSYWKFDEGSGTNAGDSADGNPGTITGATWNSSGKQGAALWFDGSGDEVSVADSNNLNITDSITISAWVWLNSDAEYGAIVNRYYSNSYYFGTGSNGNKELSFYYGATEIKSSTNSLNIGRWNHVAISYNRSSTTAKIYVNGTIKGSSTSFNPTVAGGFNNIHIGSQGGSFYFNGLIDEVRVYNRSLSESEIQQLYSDSSTEYQTTLTVPSGGVYNITAIAYGRSGNNASSIVENITITAPSPGEDTNISSGPRTLNSANTVYILNQSINCPGTCLIVNATNVTIDCQGNTINYSQSATGHGINIPVYNFTTVEDCIIIQGNQSINNSNAIYLNQTFNNTLMNDEVHTTGFSSYGIRLESSGGNNFTSIVLKSTNNSPYLRGFMSSYALTNITFSNDHGNARYPQTINASEGDVITDFLNISHSRIYLSNSASNFLNTSAEITFNEINFTNPEIRVLWNDDSTNITCPPTVCANVSYNSTSKIFVFNVSHFTTYFLQEGVSVNAPVNFTAVLAPNKQDVILNWSAVPGSDGYIVFYDDNVTKIQMLNSSDHSGTANMTLIGSSNNSWIDKTANTTQRRFYALAAYKSSTLNFTENTTGKFDLLIHNETGGVGQTMLSVPLIDYSSLDNIISNTNDWAMVYSVNDTGNEEWLYSHFETGAWQGTITSLEQGKGYYFDNFNEDTNITNVGIVPTGNVTQTIRNETGEIGQTLLGVSLKSESLQSLVPNTNDWSMVYTVNDNENEGWNLAYYESGSSGWRGAINALQPGKGYYFDNFNEDQNMTYWSNPY